MQRTIAKEDNQVMHANIRTQVSPHIRSGLQFINIPVSTTDPSLPPSAVLSQISPEDIVWEKVIDRTAIEAQILKYISAAFRAAAKSPCGHGIIHDKLTFTSLSPSAQHLLFRKNGTRMTHNLKPFSPLSQYQIMSEPMKTSPLRSPHPILNGTSRRGGNPPQCLPPDAILVIARLLLQTPSCLTA